MSRHKQADIYTKLENLPRRGAKIVGVEFSSASRYMGFTYHFDDGSRAYCSTDLGRRLPEGVEPTSLEGQQIIDLVECLYNMTDDEMTDDEFRRLVDQALNHDQWEGSGVYVDSVLRLIRFLLSGVPKSEVEDNIEGLLETVGNAVKQAKVAARVAERYQS